MTVQGNDNYFFRGCHHYNENGNAIYKSVYAYSYTAAKEKLETAILGLRMAHILPVKPQRDASSFNISFGDLSLKWLNSVKINTKDSSFAQYHHKLHKHIIPQLGKYQVSLISREQIERFLNAMLESGRLDGKGGLSEKTVLDILTMIKGIIRYAGYIGCAVSCNLDRVTVRQEKKEITVLNRREQDVLKNFLHKDTDGEKLGALLGMSVGMRIGEVCGVKWGDIDLFNKTITVRRTVQRISLVTPDESGRKTKVIVTSPKSESSVREIPLPAAIIPALEKMQTAPEAYVLTGDADRFIEPRTLQNRFKKILKDADLRDINFHLLRHSFATRYAELGCEQKTLSELLGHSGGAVTRHYVHPSMEMKRACMDRYSELLSA